MEGIYYVLLLSIMLLQHKFSILFGMDLGIIRFVRILFGSKEGTKWGSIRSYYVIDSGAYNYVHGLRRASDSFIM